MVVLLVVPDYGKWSAKLRHFIRSINGNNGAVRETLIFCSNNFNCCLVTTLLSRVHNNNRHDEFRVVLGGRGA